MAAPGETSSAAAKPSPARWSLKALSGWGLVVFFFAFVAFNAGLQQFLTFLFLGLPQGGIIAMMAMGYSMVYGIILLINFAHGEVFMFSAFLTLALIVPIDWTGPSWPKSMAIFISVIAFCVAVALWAATQNVIRSKPARVAVSAGATAAICALLWWMIQRPVHLVIALLTSAAITPAFGVTLDRIAYRPLRNAPRLIPLITAIGVSLFLMNFAQFIFGTRDYRIPDERVPTILAPYYPSWDEPEPVGMWNKLVETRTLEIPIGKTPYGDPNFLSIPLTDLIIIALCIIMMLCTTAFIQGTKTGTAMRACALDQRMARLVGIDVDRTVAITFAVGSMLAAIATPFYVIKYSPINPTMGYIVGILAFSSAVLGGIGNIRGAMAGGMLIGVIYNFVPLFETTADWPFFKWLATLSMFEGRTDWNIFAGIGEWRLGIAYIFMILVLIFKPQGLLGKAAAARRA